MIKSIFQKEFIKTRWFIIAASVTLSVFSLYLMLNMCRVINLKGALHIWEVVLYRDAIFIDLMRYLPLIAGVVLGVFQYAPEMHRKCLKLTLHLPVKAEKMIIAMLAAGVSAMLIILVPSLLIMFLMTNRALAPEMVSHIMFHSMVWYLAGILAYLFTAWITLEPTWRRRIINIIVSVLILKVFFIESVPQAYNLFLPYLGVFTVLAGSLTMLSVSRFKSGKQD